MANPQRRPGQSANPNVLRLIRISLLGPVTFFGILVSLKVQRDPPAVPESARALVYVNIAFLIGAALGILYFQRRHAAERDPARRATFNIIAWALGESTALFGVVHYLLSGSPIPFIVGLGMLMSSFVLVPVRD